MKEYEIYFVNNEDEIEKIKKELIEQNHNEKALTSIKVFARKQFNLTLTNPSYPSSGGVAIIGNYLYA